MSGITGKTIRTLLALAIGFSASVLTIRAEEAEAPQENVPEPAEENAGGFITDEEDQVYYLDPLTGDFASGMTLIGEDLYYFDPDSGTMETGFVELEEEDATLYFDQESGKMASGWQEIEECTYYFDPVSGAMKKGFFTEEKTGKTFYFNEQTGMMETGITDIAENTYYFNEETGEMMTGFVEAAEVNGTIYPDPFSGILLKGQHFIDGEWYSFDEETGVMLTGFVYIPEEKKTVYYDPEDGTRSTGELVVDGNQYYLNQETGAAASGLTKEKDVTYFIDEVSGKKLTGEIYDKGNWYYFDENTGKMVTGFKYIPYMKKTVYYDPATGKRVSGDVTIDGKVYHFDTVTGALLDGEFRTLLAGSGAAKVFVRDGRVVLHNFKYEQTYYQVNPVNGVIIHSQKLFSDKIYMDGIDISSHNGKLDLSEYQDGFVIIRAAWGTNEDTLAVRNMDLCEELKIPYGVYVYSYAINEEQLLAEADFVLDMVKGRNVPLGIWYDIEYDYYKASHMENWPNRGIITQYCQMFCDKISAAGYKTGVYSSSYWFDNYITLADGYEKWIANWGTDESAWDVDLSGKCALHQYACDPLDRNVLYIDPYTWY